MKIYSEAAPENAPVLKLTVFWLSDTKFCIVMGDLGTVFPTRGQSASAVCSYLSKRSNHAGAE